MGILQLWPPPVPIGGLLVGVREGNDCGLGKVCTADLKADGQTGSTEAAWNGDRRQTVNIECSRIDNTSTAPCRSSPTPCSAITGTNVTGTNIEHYGLDPERNVPVHGEILPIDETLARIQEEAEAAQAVFEEQKAIGYRFFGCPVRYGAYGPMP
jgi:hypothetical protein